jgi:hypothetical protein
MGSRTMVRHGLLSSTIAAGLASQVWFKKGAGTVAGTAGHRPKVGRVLRTTVPDPFLNHAASRAFERAIVAGAFKLQAAPRRCRRWGISHSRSRKGGWGTSKAVPQKDRRLGHRFANAPATRWKYPFFDRLLTPFFPGTSMETTRGNSRNTVRSRSSRSAHAVICVAVFVVTVLMVNSLDLRQNDGPAGGGAAIGPVTATVCQQFPADGPAGLIRPSQADLEQEIAGQANLRRVLLAENVGDVSAENIEGLAKNLQVSLSRGSTADTLEVSITFTDSDARRAVRVVNSLARQYAAEANAEFASLAGQPCRDVRDAAEVAGREFFEAQARFHRFLERHFREHGDRAGRTRNWLTRQVWFSPESLEAESRPGMVENPDWSELARRLSELTKQRGGLLVKRTLLHPDVRGIEKKILDCRQALEQITRYLPGPDLAGPVIEAPPGSQPLPKILPPGPVESPVESPPPLPGDASREHGAAVREFHVYKVAVDDAAEAYERLSLEERRARRRQYAPPGIELQLARVEESIQPADRSAGTMPVALVVALAMAAGVSMITSGLGNDPTLDTAEQVRARLPIPVVGTIPAANPGAVEANRRRSNRLSGLALIGYGVGLVAVGVLILLTV